jgi:hypothetical protein
LKFVAFILAATTLFGSSCLAQDQSLQDQSPQDRPLGDVARETRAQTSQAPKPAKVLVSEGSDLHPVSASDDPLEVMTRAAAALLHDTSHRCQEQASGNSGPRPGWSELTLTEIAAPDRVHVIGEFTNPKRREEEIFVGGEVYHKADNGPWEKIDAMREAPVNGGAMTVPNELKFGYKKGDLKLVGAETINGSPTLHYQDKIRDFAIDRTIDIWVGSNDNLPRRTAMVTHDLRTKIESQETTDCTYDTNIKLEPPQIQQ